MINPITVLLYFMGFFVGGGIIGYVIHKVAVEGKIANAEKLAKRIVEEAEKEAEAKRREAEVVTKERFYAEKQQFEQETKDRRQEIINLERKLDKREELIERRVEQVDSRERELASKEREVEHRAEKLKKSEAEITNLIEKEKKTLEQISGLTVEQAKDLLLKKVERDVERDMSIIIKKSADRTKEICKKKAREVVTMAIQRCASDVVQEITVSTVPLPSDDMKGRIIGREGRNIRSFEAVTGINIIIDDTPEAVVLSGFDPIRREMARLTLDRLIADGRIHPGRIEEIYAKTAKEVEEMMREAGEQSCFDAGVHDLCADMIKILGRLKYRTSYGQNVLQHSMEVSFLAGVMAAEIGADTNLCRRAGLLHDIGKSIDFEMEGTHAKLGADLAKKYNESPKIVHAIMAHHEDIEAKTVEAVLVQAADAISAARPGVRRETLETYIKRLETLENLADTFDGVEKSFAIQAGRELRIIVEPEEIDDIKAAKLAHEISQKIEKEVEYPGQIKVTVVRETRAVDYAK